ncbi:MAG: hypothetical protein RR738_01160 [Anaerorhabdus sp.]
MLSNFFPLLNVHAFAITEQLGHSKEMVENVYDYLLPNKKKKY